MASRELSSRELREYRPRFWTMTTRRSTTVARNLGNVFVNAGASLRHGVFSPRSTMLSAEGKQLPLFAHSNFEIRAYYTVQVFTDADDISDSIAPATTA